MIKIKLRELLWEKDKTGVELHNATGISQAKISEIIRGKRTNITLFSTLSTWKMSINSHMHKQIMKIILDFVEKEKTNWKIWFSTRQQ